MRDSDETWYKSVQDTIKIAEKHWYRLLTLPMGTKPIVNLAGQCSNVLERHSEGKSRKENHSLHNQWIREIVPNDKLLEVLQLLLFHIVRVN